MKKLLLFVWIFTAFVLCSEEPVMRVGIVTDTHVTRQKKSCRRLKGALEVFKRHNAELVINAGDIANDYDVKAYRNYRNTVNSVYPDPNKRPSELFVYANHDRIKRRKEHYLKVFKDVKRHLEIPNNPLHIQEFKGYQFVVVHQYVSMSAYQKMLRIAAEKAGDKPFFVIDHMPAKDTIYNSSASSDERKQLLSKYPQAVVICGHIHNTLVNELAIWQGEYTSVNAGALFAYRIVLEGVPRKAIAGDMFLLLEVYKDKLIFRRFSAESGKEYKADSPWCIPLPFNKATAPYRIEARRANEVVPVFPDDSRIVVKNDGNKVDLHFKSAKNDVLTYRIEFFRKRDGKWQLFSVMEEAGNGVLPEKMRTANAAVQVNSGLFDPGEQYRVVVTPYGFFGGRGKPIETVFSLDSSVKGKVVFESKDPMNELPFLTDLQSGSPVAKDENGFYCNTSFNSRLVFPEKVWEGKSGTRFRVTIDMHTIQHGNFAWTVVLRNPVPLANANDRISTLKGDPGMLRYVIDFVKAKDYFNYYLLIREGGSGKIKFDYVKVEVFNEK